MQGMELAARRNEFRPTGTLTALRLEVASTQGGIHSAMQRMELAARRNEFRPTGTLTARTK